MKYRITLSEKGYRAEIGYNDARNGVLKFRPIENDNTHSCNTECYYKTEQEAINACEKHHTSKGYDKLPKVVKEFEL